MSLLPLWPPLCWRTRWQASSSFPDVKIWKVLSHWGAPFEYTPLTVCENAGGSVAGGGSGSSWPGGQGKIFLPQYTHLKMTVQHHDHFEVCCGNGTFWKNFLPPLRGVSKQPWWGAGRQTIGGPLGEDGGGVGRHKLSVTPAPSRACPALGRGAIRSHQSLHRSGCVDGACGPAVRRGLVHGHPLNGGRAPRCREDARLVAALRDLHSAEAAPRESAGGFKGRAAGDDELFGVHEHEEGLTVDFGGAEVAQGRSFGTKPRDL